MTKQLPCTSKSRWTARVRHVLVQIEVAPGQHTHTHKHVQGYQQGKCLSTSVKPDVDRLPAGAATLTRCESADGASVRFQASVSDLLWGWGFPQNV